MVGRPEVEAQVEQPSAREIAAAEAARARLYGAKNSQPAQESNVSPGIDLLQCKCPAHSLISMYQHTSFERDSQP